MVFTKEILDVIHSSDLLSIRKDSYPKILN